MLYMGALDLGVNTEWTWQEGENLKDFILHGAIPLYKRSSGTGVPHLEIEKLLNSDYSMSMPSNIVSSSLKISSVGESSTANLLKQ